jgi:hypothetical protein
MPFEMTILIITFFRLTLPWRLTFSSSVVVKVKTKFRYRLGSELQSGKRLVGASNLSVEVVC